MNKTEKLKTDEGPAESVLMKLLSRESMSFSKHKEKTAQDCEEVAKMLNELAATVREGNMAAFEQWWLEGGTEEGDAKIFSIRERIILRYVVRNEKVA